MAAHISEYEISKLNIEPYETIRGQLRSGDLIFCSGRSLFSRIIKRFTKSTFSHCGMVFRVESIDRIMVLESGRNGGVHLTPLSFYTKIYPGKVMLARLSEDIQPDSLTKIFSFGFDQMTRPYDKKELIRIVKRMLFNAGRRIKNRHFVCSELVYDCFAKGNILFEYENKVILPDYIWDDIKVNQIARIK